MRCYTTRWVSTRLMFVPAPRPTFVSATSASGAQVHRHLVQVRSRPLPDEGGEGQVPRPSCVQDAPGVGLNHASRNEDPSKICSVSLTGLKYVAGTLGRDLAAMPPRSCPPCVFFWEDGWRIGAPACGWFDLSPACEC